MQFAGETLLDLLLHRAKFDAEDMGYLFLKDGESHEDLVTYSQLDRRVKAVAAHLQGLNVAGQRVLIQLEAGIDYLVAFYACIYAGAIGVPSHPHRSSRTLPRLKAILADCGARIAITSSSVLADVNRRLPGVPGLEHLMWVNLENIDSALADAWSSPDLEANMPAFLQYTSGSTSEPKGVIVTHGNILANVRMMTAAWEATAAHRIVTWLPPFHDMGLIGCILQSLYLGSGCVMLAPIHFLQKPVRWLDAISRYRGHVSGGPNFAFDLCVEKIDDDEVSKLVLNSLDICFNGAEPIRAQSLERFARKFAPSGFRPKSFFPCYGLAEATLMVSGKTALTVRTLDSFELSRGNAVEAKPQSDRRQQLVSCGCGWLEEQIAIVNPETSSLCGPDEVGEVWVTGLNVCAGYWNKPEITQATFGARLKGHGSKHYLRTGDLGFLKDDQLYIVGRLKDLIIIRGRNYYPQDIELTVESTHSDFQRHGTAAFSIEVQSKEHLVVVQEVQRDRQRSLAIKEAIRAIRSAVTVEYGLQVYAVVLCKQGSVPKTSSGKVQRRACKQAFLEQTLNVLAQDELNLESEQQHPWTLTRKSLYEVEPSRRLMLLDALLCIEIARLLRVPTTRFEFDQPICSFGLDELSLAELLGKLRDQLDVEFTADALLTGITVADLAQNIAEEWSTQVPTELIQAHDTAPEHDFDKADQLIGWLRESREPARTIVEQCPRVPEPASGVAITLPVIGETADKGDARTLRLVHDRVVEWLQAEIDPNIQQLDYGASLLTRGIDSVGATSIVFRLEEDTGIPLKPGMIYEYPSIAALAAYLNRLGFNGQLRATPAPIATPTTSPSVAPRMAAVEPQPDLFDHVQYYQESNLRFRAFRETGHYYFGTPVDRQESAWVECQGQRMLMMASYSYLGLIGHPEIQEASVSALGRYGTSAHGARLLAGTFADHLLLEDELARFMRSEDAIVFSSGFVTNLATVAALVSEGDVVIGDEFNHASIVDGCQFSKATYVTFKHNDIDALARQLRKYSGRRTLVVVDSVYSMEGDVADLPRVVTLCKENGALLMVDEAHSIGVLGQTGRGVQEHFNLPDDAIDIKMGTLSKAIASCGGFVAARSEIIDFLKHHARGFMFSGSLPATQVAAARKCLELIMREPWRTEQLKRNAIRFACGLRELGFRVPPTESPIVPVVFTNEHDTLEMVGKCRELGLFVVPVFYPAVPMNAPRIRATVIATQTEQEIDFALDVFARAGRSIGLIAQ